MKKFISAILLMAAMVLSVSTFVSCNDLKEDIEKVTTDTTALQQEVAALDAALKTANENVTKAQKAADDALAAAKDAQDDADAAAKAADDLKKALANLATEQAIRDAIKAAIDEVNEKIADLKGQDEELLEAIAEVNAKIADLKIPNMPDLTPYAKNADLLALQGRITTLENTVQNYNDLITETEVNALLKDYVKKEDLASQLVELNKLLGENGEIATIKDKLTKIEEYLDDEYYLSLKSVAENAANKVLKSIAYIPHTISGQYNAIEDGFYSILRCVPSQNLEDDGTCSSERVGVEWITSSCAEFRYRVNPIDAKITKEELSFIGINVKTKATGDMGDYMEIVEFVENDGEGEIVVKARLKEDVEIEKQAVLVALQVANDNYVIVSDYTAIADQDLTQYSIVNPENNLKHFNVCWHTDVLPLTELNAGDGNGNFPFYEAQAITPDVVMTPVELVYSGQVCLLEYVATYCEELEETLDEALPCVDVTYEFSLPEVYNSPVDKVTNQQVFVDWANQADGILEVKPRKDIADAEAAKIVAVGKTPIVKVVAKANGIAVAKAYIKIDIVEEPTVVKPDLPDFEVEVRTKTYDYANLGDIIPYDLTEKTGDYITWDELTTKVLADAGIYMSNQQFAENYNLDFNTIVSKTEAKIDNPEDWEPLPGAGCIGIVADAKPATPTSTAKFGYGLTNKIHENCSGSVTITVPSTNVKEWPNLKLTFKFVVKHDPKNVFPAFRSEYNESEIVTVKGHDVNGVYNFETVLKEAFEDVKTDGSNVCGANHSKIAFKLGKDEKRAVLSATAPTTFATAETYDWTTTTINLNNTKTMGDVMVTLNDSYSNYDEAGTLVEQPTNLVWTGAYMDIPVTMYTILKNGNECSRTYTVRFYNPFAAELANIAVETIETTNTVEMLKSLTVTYQGAVIYEKGAYAADTKGQKLDHQFSIVGKQLPASFKEQKRLVWNKKTITWNNGGTVLDEDKTFDVALYVYNENVGWFPIKDSSKKVTVKKTVTE